MTKVIIWILWCMILTISAGVAASVDMMMPAAPFISREAATSFFTTTTSSVPGICACTDRLLDRDGATCRRQGGAQHYTANPTKKCYMEIREIRTNSIANADDETPVRKFSYKKKVGGRPPRHGKAMKPTGILWHKQSRHATAPPPDPCSPQEQSGAEIVFVVDSSASQSPVLFAQQKTYIQSFISNFPIGPSHYQVAIASYSFAPYVHCHLNTHSNETGLNAAVDLMSFESGASYTGSALKVVGEEMLTATNGLRSGKPRYVIVLTDGMSSNMEDTKAQAQLLQTDSTLFAVAFGTQIYHPELMNIASDCRKVFPSSLQDPVFTILRNHLPVCPECSRNTSDVAILFDASTDVTPTQFSTATDALIRLLEATTIGTDNVHVSYTQFAQDVHDQFDFLTYNTSNNVIKHIVSQQARYPGPSNLTTALDHATNNGFLDNRGRRPDARKFAIVFTAEGQFDDFAAVETSANALKNSGVTLAVVSMRTERNVDVTPLLGLASHPAFAFALSVPGIDLCSIVSSIEFDVCEFD